MQDYFISISFLSVGLLISSRRCPACIVLTCDSSWLFSLSFEFSHSQKRTFLTFIFLHDVLPWANTCPLRPTNTTSWLLTAEVFVLLTLYLLWLAGVRLLLIISFFLRAKCSSVFGMNSFFLAHIFFFFWFRFLLLFALTYLFSLPFHMVYH